MPVTLTDLLAGRALPDGRPLDAPGRLPVAVLTMEVQRGAVGDLAVFPQLAEEVASSGMLTAIGRLLAAARRHDVPVVHCTAEFRADRAGSVANCPMLAAVRRYPGHMLAGSPSAALMPELGPEPGDLICSRLHGVSPFAGTALDAMLRNLGARVLVVTGVSLNVGVLGLCMEAANLGYQLAVPTDAVAGAPAEYSAAVLRHSVTMLAKLTSVADVEAAFDSLDV